MVNGNEAIRTAGEIGIFFLRHAVATALMVLVLCLLWTFAYFALLIWAMVSGGGVGSPVVYPIGLLLCLIGGTAACFGIFFPCAAIAEWIAKRNGLPILFQIPISAAILAGGSLLIAGVIAAIDHQVTVGAAAASVGILFVTNLLPLGFYWWIAQSGPLLLSLYRKFRSLPSPAQP